MDGNYLGSQHMFKVCDTRSRFGDLDQTTEIALCLSEVSRFVFDLNPDREITGLLRRHRQAQITLAASGRVVAAHPVDVSARTVSRGDPETVAEILGQQQHRQAEEGDPGRVADAKANLDRAVARQQLGLEFVLVGADLERTRYPRQPRWRI